MTDKSKLGHSDIPGTSVYTGGMGTQAFPSPDDEEPVALAGTFKHGSGLKPGEFIKDRYKIEHRMRGAWGESEIYLCRDEHLPEGHNNRVVVKLYENQLGPRQEIIEALTNLSHPDLIRILDIGHWDERFFEVLEFCEGGSLAERVPYTPAQLRTILPQIVSGLDYCHSSGIIHRDIKPTNLLSRDDEGLDIVLTDFGISSYLRGWQDQPNEVNQTGTAERNTLDYSAPELLSDAEISFKTDYYSLGITLLHLILGRSPFSGMRQQAIISAHQLNRIHHLDSLEPQTAQLIRGLTQFDPDNRWGRIQIEQWLNEEPVKLADGGSWEHRSHITNNFPDFPEATDPAALAHAIATQALKASEAARLLARRNITIWVESFDRDLASEIEPLEDLVTKEPEKAMRRLLFLLDQSL